MTLKRHNFFSFLFICKANSSWFWVFMNDEWVAFHRKHVEESTTVEEEVARFSWCELFIFLFFFLCYLITRATTVWEREVREKFLMFTTKGKRTSCNFMNENLKSQQQLLERYQQCFLWMNWNVAVAVFYHCLRQSLFTYIATATLVVRGDKMRFKSSATRDDDLHSPRAALIHIRGWLCVRKIK